MRKTLRLIPLALALVCSAVSMPLQAAGDYASKMKLRYTSQSGKTPSEGAWMEYSLPIGNGQLGATFMGGVATEYLQFNEKTLWTGASNDYDVKGNEDNGAVTDYGAYQNFGVLTMTNNGTTSSPSNYVRELNLMNATGKVEYTCSSVAYTREFIASYPDQVVAVRLSAGTSGKLSYTFSLAKGAGLSSGSISYANGGISLSGSLESVNYASHFKIVNSGGTLTTNSSNIKVSGADEILILLAAGTSYTSTSTGWNSSATAANVLSTMQNRTAAAASKGWSQLYADHVADYQEYFNRVKFDLNGSTEYASSTTTQSLIDNYAKGTSANDLLLEQLYFAYGRYLEIASSRGVALPSNLQGIWNHVDASAADIWNCDIHFNINTQMNYWPAEATDLGDMHMPFLNYIMNMSKSGPWKLYASNEISNSKSSNGAPVTGATPDGTEWTTFTENNIFGGVGWWAHDNQEANAWLSNHLWQHFEYSMDYDFLVEALPTMVSASKFWFNRLYKDSDGSWVVPDSYSPEQGSHGVVAAYTQQLVYELLCNTTDAIAALEAEGKALPSVCTSAFREMLAKCMANMDKGLATESVSSTTLLKEWKNVTQTSSHLTHRHMSHLMCMYPFSQVSEYNTDFFSAAKNSLTKRGDAATGWAMGWKINLWARALDGDHAHTILENALVHSVRKKYQYFGDIVYIKDETKGGVYYNLWSSHAPFQIDGNFGATSGIAEMLFQSHSGVLNILPALPSEWKGGGTITGLKGRGNFTVGITWTKDVNTANVTIVSNKGQACNVKCGGIDLTTKYVAVNGNPVDPATIKAVEGKAGAYNIPCKQGDEITIDVTRASEYVAPVEKTVETPTFSPNGGEVQAGATVTISCATDGAKIYYTTNGTTPTTASTLYSGAITMNEGMTLKAIAVKDGYTNSAVAQATFTIKAKEVVATPAFSISGGEVEEGTQVTISCATSGATVYYTTDGSAPSTSSAKYTGAITISKAMTIKAIAVKDRYYTNSQVASATFTIKAKEVVATPAFSISGGEVEEGTQVTISCATSGATVYYTTDGSAPSASSAKYTGAITISKAMTIKAIAVKDGYYTNSAVASATFTIKAKEVVATPVISPNGGEYESSATVTLTCATEGATIYYTLDGSTPTTASAVYSKAFTLTESATVKAMAVKSGYYTNSAVSSAVFTITQPAPVQVQTPVVSPAGGEYESSVTVSIACATEGATIYYTTNGTEPTTSSAVYTSAITLTESCTLKAMAAKSGNYTASQVVSAVYTITEPVVEPEPEPEPEPEEPTNACGDYLTWEYTDGVLTISGEGDMYNYSTDEPAPWNEVAKQVTQIVLPDGITRIGNYAFYNCTGVASITFTDNDCAFPKTAFSSMTKTYLVIDDAEHKDFALNANTYSMVTIKCKLNTTNYGTIIMPFTPGYQARNNFRFYKMRSLGGNYIYYTRVTSPQANVPYVYKNSSTNSSSWASEIASANNVTIKATEAPFTSSGEWKMIGNYQNMTITDTDRLSYTYMMSNNSLVNTSKAVTIYPLHPYFEGPVYDSNARQMQLVILDDDDATSIYIVQGDEQEETKAYDLQGRRVKKMIPGQMYIVNGQKILFQQ